MKLFVFSALPIALMFSLERYALYRLARAQKGQEWVRSKFWLHPNFISRCRYPAGILSLLIYHMGSLLDSGNPESIWHHAGILCFAFWTISDITDGTIARDFELHSTEGESIDPLSDKLLVLPPLFYFAIIGVIPLIPVVIFLIIDLIGQFSRYFIANKAANLFGKAKTFLVVITLILIAAQQMYFPGNVWEIYKMTLIGALFLAFFSMFFKIVPNYWYANILSLLNLVCGIAGIILIIFFHKVGLAFALVFLGQFLDMFDGRAADRWGSTPRGELLDDLADGTNFGGSISLIIYFSFDRSLLGAALAILHFVVTSYRLYRFLKNKKMAGIEGGVELFSGLPAPAGALLAGSTALLQANEGFRIACLIGTTLLMVSEIPYIHFGRVILPAIPKLIKVFLLVMILLIIWYGFRSGNLQFLYWAFFTTAVVYVVTGHKWRPRKRNAT